MTKHEQLHPPFQMNINYYYFFYLSEDIRDQLRIAIKRGLYLSIHNEYIIKLYDEIADE